MEGHNFEQLKQHILTLSESNVFEVARTEWKLHSIEISEEWDSCPCGQSIKEHCYIENQKNGKKTYVGNVCINRFMKIDTGTLIDGLKRIRKNIRANANEALIEYARQKGYLYGEKDYNFLLSTMNKRKLSEAQLSWKEKINNRILKGTVVQKRTSR